AAGQVRLGVRAPRASRSQREVIAAARAPGKPVYLHADPAPRAMGANPGYEPAALAGATGIVLSCWDPLAAPGLVSRAGETAPPGTAIAASLLAAAGPGGDPPAPPAQAAPLRAA